MLYPSGRTLLDVRLTGSTLGRPLRQTASGKWHKNQKPVYQQGRSEAGLPTNGITFRFHTDLAATPSVLTQKVPEQFSTITKKAFNLIVSNLINDRLKSALKTETAKAELLTLSHDENNLTFITF